MNILEAISRHYLIEELVKLGEDYIELQALSNKELKEKKEKLNGQSS